MNAAYVSALAALAGSAIGGLTSLLTAWLTQSFQARSQHTFNRAIKLEELYGHFIDEASRMAADALSHQSEDVSSLVKLYSLVGRMRLLSSPAVVQSAESVVEQIVEARLAPNQTLSELRASLSEHHIDPLRSFGEICRAELLALDSPLLEAAVSRPAWPRAGRPR